MPSRNQHAKPLIPHRYRAAILALLVVGFFIALLALGIVPRVIRHSEVMAASKPVLPTVYTTTPSFSHAVPPLSLPGEIQAYYASNIYSRISGTLKMRTVDIGSHVSAGQLLATIDVPDTDQQVLQAKAQLAQAQQGLIQAKANLDFSAISLRRWLAAGKGGALSQQDIDQHRNDYNVQQANYQAAQAAVKSAEANLNRYVALAGYEKITAPFTGIISQRNVDPGANIVAGGSSTSTGLFRIEQIDTLRIYVDVPQAFVPQIKVGMPVQVAVQEFPGQIFTGRVFSTAQMLDPTSRTLLTQIFVPNPNHKLYPGLYATATFISNPNNKMMTVADNTIVTANHGLKVISVTPDNHLHILPIQVGKDYGIEVEVLGGLTGQEKLVTNPLDTFREGQPINVAKAPAANPKH